jgi:peptidoglycan hydrolase-like amidase
MNASCPAELLRAHAVVSRSWLLAQLDRGLDSLAATSPDSSPGEIIRWYGRGAHDGFDVCADDHCQRYQGIGKASPAAREAVAATRGMVLMSGREICDARYSKCCGGRTEVFSTAWEDRDVPYLASIYDGEGDLAGFSMPLSSNCNAGRFIDSDPPAFCNTRSADLLARILPGFDQATSDFYRWEVDYGAEELGEIVESRLGLGLGSIRKLEPLERGPSGRIRRLGITGRNGRIVIGKELEIRRTLSRSHLYSSAFVVRTLASSTGQVERFRLSGAGWGHGVGLCQIGAAVMADMGRSHEEILAHYFRGAKIERLYRSSSLPSTKKQ